jgi:hypothetical protein
MIARFRKHYRTQYQLSLLAGFGPRKAARRALRTYIFGF